MQRKTIQINEDLCNGCGLCTSACHEGALALVDGKARLLHQEYCDGLGHCLPACPTGAITFVGAADEPACPTPDSADPATGAGALPCGCPGSAARSLPRPAAPAPQGAEDAPAQASALAQWPVQLRLVPPTAPYFDGAHLLVAADCTAFALGDFHQRFMQGRVTLIGCPKLDDVRYAGKLTEILQGNLIRSVTVVRMEVPCCAGLANAAIEALEGCGRMIPWRVVTLGTDGRIVDEGI